MKGVSGFYLVVIITIIIAIVLIALFLIFQDVFTKGITKYFSGFVNSILAAIRGILGPWASIVMPGL